MFESPQRIASYPAGECGKAFDRPWVIFDSGSVSFLCLWFHLSFGLFPTIITTSGSYLSFLRTHLYLSSMVFFSISRISRVCVFWKWGFDDFFEPFFLPSHEWPSIFIIKGRGEAGFTFQPVVPEHKHFIAWGMWVIALGGNIPLSKIRSYLNISGSSSQLSPAEAFIGMYGGAYTVVTFNTILDYRGQ